MQRGAFIAVAVLCVLGGAIAVGPGAAISCFPEPAVGIHVDDGGGWWIPVERYDANVTIYHLPDRRSVADSHTVSVPANHSEPSILGLERGDDDQWYVLTTDRVHVFGADWEPTNRSIDLPSSTGVRNGEGGIARDDAGRWWVALGDILYRYSDTWERTATLHVSADGVSAIDGDVQVLQGKTVARIEDPDGDPSVRSTWSMGSELSDPAAITQPDGGWNVLDSDGTVYRYTPYGQYTGAATELPIDAGDCRWSFALFGVLYFLSPVLIAIWVLLPLAVVTFFRPERWLEVLGTSAVGLVGALAVSNYWLPWPFAVIYWLPDLLIGTLVVLTVIFLVTRFIDDARLSVVALVLVSPLVLVAFTTSPFALLVGPAIALTVFHLLDRRRTPPQAG
ncbi:Ig-like domain-containing protein [Halorhabdus sp. SVX81]|uniref:Ig-like domain-containing protein n=1 Tax=Halorhabdus sp. SVX81 TaxID=2978283 RepID=UPI0023DB16BE|nr:Ig-like domain-containing protein [Halorhabdus sp. SVX81]